MNPIENWSLLKMGLEKPIHNCGGSRDRRDACPACHVESVEFEHIKEIASLKECNENQKADRQRTAEKLIKLTDENVSLKAELNRRKGDPVTRLHNICEAIQEDAKESPFSKEEWARMDAEQVRLQGEVTRLKAELEKIQGIDTVAGVLDCSIANLINRIEVHIHEIQVSISTDNALLATLCDSIRLGREYAENGKGNGAELESLRKVVAVAGILRRNYDNYTFRRELTNALAEHDSKYPPKELNRKICSICGAIFDLWFDGDGNDVWELTQTGDPNSPEHACPKFPKS